MEAGASAVTMSGEDAGLQGRDEEVRWRMSNAWWEAGAGLCGRVTNRWRFPVGIGLWRGILPRSARTVPCRRLVNADGPYSQARDYPFVNETIATHDMLDKPNTIPGVARPVLAKSASRTSIGSRTGAGVVGSRR